MINKNQGIFIEVNEYSTLVAHASGLEPPLTLLGLTEFAAGADPEEVRQKIADLVGLKGTAKAQGRCSVYPRSRFVRRGSVDPPSKVNDTAFLVEMLTTQFRIDPALNSVSVISAFDGSAPTERPGDSMKEVIFCGAESEELDQLQADLVDLDVYPTRLELGSVACVAALKHYSISRDLKLPTLVMEITSDNANVFIYNQEKLDISRPIPFGLNSMFPVIQQELGLKDEDSARKLFHSNTFDFTEMGPVLLKKMLKELQASTGFYEVQTGQTIGQIFLSLLPKNLNWIHNTLSRALGVEVLHVDYAGWLKALDVSVAEGVQLEGLDSRWVGLFGLMGNYNRS